MGHHACRLALDGEESGEQRITSGGCGGRQCLRIRDVLALCPTDPRNRLPERNGSALPRHFSDRIGIHGVNPVHPLGTRDRSLNFVAAGARV